MAIGTPVERKAVSVAGLAVSPHAFSPASTITAGTLAVLVFTSGGNKQVTAVSDNAGGNTWVVDHVATDATRAISVASCQVQTAITSSNSISVTLSNTTNSTADYWVQEVSGLATSSAFDKSHDGSGSSTSPSSGATATLAQADEIVFGAARTSASATWTKGVGYSDPTTKNLGSTSALEYRIVSSTAAVTAAGTFGTTGSWVATVVTYKGATAAAVVTHARPLVSPLRQALGPLGA